MNPLPASASSSASPHRRRWLLVPAFFLSLLLSVSSPVSAQPARDRDSIPASSSARIRAVAVVSTVAYAGTLAVLSSTWYSKDTRSKFHTFDDSREWLQVDKTGHAWTAYNTARANSRLWEWAGLPHKKAVLVGGITSAAFITGIEVMDGYSAKWGWSWSDIGANVFGSGLFVGQELLWAEQRIQYKFSFHRKDYHDPMLERRADDLFGNSLAERMLKDYNAQTYWFSFNIHSFMKTSDIPAWLNLSVGYGADGMYGGFHNTWQPDGQPVVDRSDIPRKRQLYLSPDVDFTKIPTKSRFLKSTFFVLNAFKFPAPALMLDSKGKLKGYAIYF